MRVPVIKFDLGTVSINCTPDEVEDTLAALLREMRLVLPMLRVDEREILRNIMANKSCSLTVADVFPDFARNSEAHRTLRRLRAAQFVRPANTGRWDPTEPIEVKPFARLMWNHLGEEGIFAEVPEQNAAHDTPAQTRAVTPVEEDEIVIDDDPVAWEKNDAVDLLDFANEEVRGSQR